VRSVRLRLGDRGSLSVPTRDGFFQFRVPDSVLAHTDPSGLRALDAQGRVVASEKLFAPFPEGLAFGGIARPPGGAALAQKHELVLRPTPAGPASIWAAPSSVAPARCTWLQIGLAVYGGGCRRYQTPGRGLSEAVPLRLRVKGKALRVLWGQAGSDVARLEVLFQDGSKTSLPLTDGVFLYPIPDSRWSAGHRPAFLVARDRGGHTLAKRLLYEFTLAPA
jgi:hypothetical protein